MRCTIAVLSQGYFAYRAWALSKSLVTVGVLGSLVVGLYVVSFIFGCLLLGGWLDGFYGPKFNAMAVLEKVRLQRTKARKKERKRDEKEKETCTNSIGDGGGG